MIKRETTISLNTLLWYNSRVAYINDDLMVKLTFRDNVKGEGFDEIDWTKSPFKGGKRSRLHVNIYFTDESFETFLNGVDECITKTGDRLGKTDLINMLGVGKPKRSLLKLGTTRIKDQRYVLETLMIRSGLPTSTLLFGDFTDIKGLIDFSIGKNYGLTKANQTRYYLNIKGAINHPTEGTANEIITELIRYKQNIKTHNGDVVKEIAEKERTRLVIE